MSVGVGAGSRRGDGGREWAVGMGEREGLRGEGKRG